MPIVIEERWTKLQGLSLKSGAHSPNSTFCVMEAVAYVAGEPWSDKPECACPIISAFLRSWNDALPTDADRDRLLKSLIPKLVNTRGDKALEEKRAMMAADWLVRVHTPAWLRLAGLTTHADALAALPEITSFKQVPSIRGPIEAARKDADAAWDAAGDAARAAARDAARAALQPTVLELHRSAFVLLDRMLPTEVIQLPAVGVEEAERVCGVPIYA